MTVQFSCCSIKTFTEFGDRRVLLRYQVDLRCGQPRSKTIKNTPHCNLQICSSCDQLQGVPKNDSLLWSEVSVCVFLNFCSRNVLKHRIKLISFGFENRQFIDIAKKLDEKKLAPSGTDDRLLMTLTLTLSVVWRLNHGTDHCVLIWQPLPGHRLHTLTTWRIEGWDCTTYSK